MTSPSKPSKEKPLYHVIAGSFKNKRMAKSRVAFLKQQQIDAVVRKTWISGETYYRVQAGAFSKQSNAKNRVAELENIGVSEPFISTNSSTSKNSSVGSRRLESTIRDNPQLTAAEMNRFANHLNPDAPKLGGFYEVFGKHYGIRGDIAFAQALHETNNFHFTGVVNPEQHNYSGIGATDPRRSGANFPSEEKGVLAHIQHLYAYATTGQLPEGYPLVDPCFDLVHRGSAKTWVALNGKWAVPGNGYGQSILGIYQGMVRFTNRKKVSPRPSWIQRSLHRLWNRVKQVLRKLKL